MEDAEAIFSALCLATRQAGIVANAFQGKVQNEKKHMSATKGEPVRITAAKEAKTIIDETIQDILLLALKNVIDPQSFVLDAEEDTPFVKIFRSDGNGASIIIDPIDGTLEYLEGRDDFSVCICAIEDGRMALAFVFFPRRDVAYAIAPNGKSYQYKSFSSEGIQQASEIILPKEADKVVYKMRHVPDTIVTSLKSAGYMVIDDLIDSLMAPNAILKMLDGTACAYMCANYYIRDAMLGAIVGNAKGAYTANFKGAELRWPQKGRVPEAIFGNTVLENELKKLTPL